MYIFPMGLIAEFPIGTAIIFLFFFFLDVYFSCGYFSGIPVGTGFFFLIFVIWILFLWLL